MRRIRLLTLQICGKCIGGAVSRWCSAAASVENYAIKPNQAHLPRLICVVWPILSEVFFAMVGPGLLIGYIEGWRIDDALYSNFASYSGYGRTCSFVTQLKE